MNNPPYSPQFREQALAKVHARKNSTIDQVALELNIIPGTLKSWMRCYLLISDRIFYLFSIITKSKNKGVFTTFAS
jgi:hypothetical protein